MRTLISSKTARWFLLAAVCMIGVGAACAQPDGVAAQDVRTPRERIETVIIGKFSTELNLTPEQAEKFFPRFRQFQNEVQDVRREQMDQRQDLNNLARDKDADQGHVEDVLNKQGDTEKKLTALKQDFLKDVSGILTPQQVSKCSILLDDLPKRVQQFINERRDHGSNPGMQRDRSRRHAR